MEIHSVNSKLSNALQKRQKSYAIVQSIGDIFLEYVPLFEPFIKYGAHQLWGKHEFEREKSINPTFSRFVEVFVIVFLYQSQPHYIYIYIF